jgi:hypothetical protein
MPTAYPPSVQLYGSLLCLTIVIAATLCIEHAFYQPRRNGVIVKTLLSGLPMLVIWVVDQRDNAKPVTCGCFGCAGRGNPQ